MAATDTARMRDLETRDLAGALALSAQVGWNQVEADWRIFLELGHAVGFDDPEGRLAGTAAILPSGRDVAWISMVIVRPDHRRQGLATRLLEQCADEIAAAGRTPGLDATPAGREVYRRLGFQDSWTLARWRRRDTSLVPPAAAPAGVHVHPLEPADLDALARLDRATFGVDRKPLLERLLARSSAFAALALAGGTECGFLLGRDGRTATHLGPVCAESPAIARALGRHALERAPGAVIVDVADAATGFTDWLGSGGFARERPFTRMYRGPSAPRGDLRRAVAVAGPELG